MPKTLQTPTASGPYPVPYVSSLTPEPQSSPLRAAEREMSELLTSLAEALGKSCVYFSPDNIKYMAPPPPTPPLLEDLDGRMRGLLAHSEGVPAYEKRKEQLPETVGDMFAAAGAVHHAAELFRLLRLVRMPPFGFAPLVRMTDQVIILFLTTAAALEQDDPNSARSAMRATIQVRTLCEEMQGIIADLSTFLPQKSWKMLKASADSLMVATEAVGRVAQRMAGQTISSKDAATPTNRAPANPAPKRKAEPSTETMPTQKGTGGKGLVDWIRTLFSKH